MSETSSRRSVVIGGASGIGAEIATQLASDGWSVVVADLNENDAAALAHQLGPSHSSQLVNVTDEVSVAALFESCNNLDLVVNTAGTSTLGRLTEHDTADFRKVVDVVLLGAFLVLKHAGAGMEAGGSIVTLASLNARQSAVGMAAYCAAKAGVVALSEVAAMELGRKGIRVNTISPGFVATPLTEPALGIPGVLEEYTANSALGQVGTSSDVAQAVRYIADAQWLTGENLDLNGGAHLYKYPNLLEMAEAAFS